MPCAAPRARDNDSLGEGDGDGDACSSVAGDDCCHPLKAEPLPTAGDAEASGCETEESSVPATGQRRRCGRGVLCAVAVVLGVVLTTAAPSALMLSEHRAELRNVSSRHFWEHERESMFDAKMEALGRALFKQFRSLTEHITPGTRSRAPEETHCTHNNQLFPGQLYSPKGTLEGLRWEPDAACRLKHFNSSTASSCLARSGLSFAMVGDSLMSGLAKALAHKLNTTLQVGGKEYDVRGRGLGARPNTAVRLPGGEASVLEFFWTQSVYLMDPTDGRQRRNVSDAVSSADYVFLHHGTWDFGRTCQGVYAFYRSLKERLVKIRSEMKPSAQLVLFDLHYFFQGKCVEKYGLKGKCFAWNTPDKVAVYRDAMRQAAACTGSRVYSNFGVYKSMPHFTKDGVHFERGPVFDLEMDIFLNGVCPRDDEPRMEFTKFECNEAVHLPRWSAVPRATYCPHDPFV